MTGHRPSAWDEAAADFDRAPDHGLRDPDVRAAWAALLMRMLPAPPCRLADLGCGTGSLAVLAVELGHDVHGIDFSPQMVALARAKATGRAGVRFSVGDASAPPLVEGGFDAVLCRHVLWALPDPRAALQHWVGLLRPHGRLVLVEGRWATGAGLSSRQTLGLLRGLDVVATVEPLPDAAYWGGPVDDDRYAVLARRQGPSPARPSGPTPSTATSSV